MVHISNDSFFSIGNVLMPYTYYLRYLGSISLHIGIRAPAIRLEAVRGFVLLIVPSAMR